MTASSEIPTAPMPFKHELGRLGTEEVLRRYTNHRRCSRRQRGLDIDDAVQVTRRFHCEIAVSTNVTPPVGEGIHGSSKF